MDKIEIKCSGCGRILDTGEIFVTINKNTERLLVSEINGGFEIDPLDAEELLVYCKNDECQQKLKVIEEYLNKGRG